MYCEGHGSTRFNVVRRNGQPPTAEMKQRSCSFLSQRLWNTNTTVHLVAEKPDVQLENGRLVSSNLDAPENVRTV